MRLLEANRGRRARRSVRGRHSLRAAIDETAPDVVVTDIRMPPTGTDEGIRIADGLRDTHPEIGVVVLSQFLEPLYALALLERGAAGRGIPVEGARARPRSARRLRSGRSPAAARSSTSKVVETLVAARSRSEASPLASSTPRERQIARGDGARKVECRDRASARDHGALCREGDPFDLPEARAHVAARHQPARQGCARRTSSEEGLPPGPTGDPSAPTR